MAHMIKLTLPGGTYFRKENDEPIFVNANEISSILPAENDDEVYKSIITMRNGNFHRVKENPVEINRLINKA